MAIRPRPVSTSRRSCKACIRTTVLATDKARPKTKLVPADQPSSRARPMPSSADTAICTTAPGITMLRTESRSLSEKCRPTPNISRITPISASCDATFWSATQPGVRGPTATPASRYPTMIEMPSRFAIVASTKARPRPITTMAMSDDPCDMPFGYLEDWRPAFAVRRSSRARVTAAATKVRLMRTNRIGLSFAIISKRRSIGFAQHVAGHDQLLDLARAFGEPEQPDVAVEALHAGIGDVGRAAPGLPRAAAEQRVRRHAAILEDDVAGMGAALPHLAVGRAQLEAGIGRLDQEGGDAARALVLGVGARHHGEQGRLGRVGDEALGAVQRPAVPRPARRRLEAGGVGAGAGLGQGKGGDDLARGKPRQVFAPLLLGAVDDDALAADAVIGAVHGTEGRRGLAQLEQHLGFLAHAEAEPALGLGDGHAEQAEPAHLRDDRRRHRIGLGHLGLGRDEALAHEAGNGVEELTQGLRVERHGRFLPLVLAIPTRPTGRDQPNVVFKRS